MAFSRLDRTGWLYRIDGGSWTASGACIDGNLTTYTSFNHNSLLDLDMGSAQTFSGLEIYSPLSGDYTPRTIEVYVSSDATNWGSAIATLNVKYPDQPNTTQYFDLGSQTYRYIRFKNLANWRPGWGGDYYPDVSAIRLYEVWPGVGGSSVAYDTQVALEVLFAGESTAKVTQSALEVIVSTSSTAYVTQCVLEVIVSVPTYKKARRVSFVNCK